MRSLIIVCIVLLFSCAACETRPSPSPEKLESPSVPKVVVERDKVEREQPLPPEVKIKLRRDGKDHYSWELSGSDVNQILTVNEKLKKRVGGEQAK